MHKAFYTIFLALFIALFVGLGIDTFYPGPEAPQYPAELEQMEMTGKCPCEEM